MESVRIVNNEVKKRFETTVDGHLGVVEYKRLGEKLALIHTEVPEEIGGRGIASQLAKYALDFARNNKLKVLPYCPFIAQYIKEHPEYEDLVDDKMRK